MMYVVMYIKTKNYNSSSINSMGDLKLKFRVSKDEVSKRGLFLV